MNTYIDLFEVTNSLPVTLRKDMATVQLKGRELVPDVCFT